MKVNRKVMACGEQCKGLLLRACLGPGGVAALRPRLATGDGVFRHHLLGTLLLAVEPSL